MRDPSPPRKSSHPFPKDKLRAFWSRVIKGLGNQCWGWKGRSKDGSFRVWRGHGQTTTFSPRRVIYEETYEPIPPSTVVQNTCGDKKCMNPEHMTLVRRGSHAYCSRYPETLSQAPRCRLSMEEAESIRNHVRAQGRGSRTALAVKYGRHLTTIDDIVNHKTWTTTSQEKKHAQTSRGSDREVQQGVSHQAPRDASDAGVGRRTGGSSKSRQ